MGWLLLKKIYYLQNSLTTCFRPQKGPFSGETIQKCTQRKTLLRPKRRLHSKCGKHLLYQKLYNASSSDKNVNGYYNLNTFIYSRKYIQNGIVREFFSSLIYWGEVCLKQACRSLFVVKCPFMLDGISK
jgi:hypothetical protein